MFRVTNPLIQAAQIKPQLNRPDNWVKYNQNLNDILAIANLWKILTKDKAQFRDTVFENYATWEDN